MKTKELSQKLLKQFDLDLVNLKKRDHPSDGRRIIPLPSSSSASDSSIDEMEIKKRFARMQNEKLKKL